MILFKLEIVIWRFPFVLLRVFQYSCLFCSNPKECFDDFHLYYCMFFNIIAYVVQNWNISFFDFHENSCVIFNILFKIEIICWGISFVLLYVSQYFVQSRNGILWIFICITVCFFNIVQLSYFPAAPEATGSYPEATGSLCFPVPPRTLGINQTGHIYIYIYVYIYINIYK